MPPEETAGWILLGALVTVAGIGLLTTLAAIVLDLFQDYGWRGLVLRVTILFAFVVSSYYVGMGLSRI